MKIYTKTGDSGLTSLFGGDRVQKDDVRIEAYGSTDELNSFIAQLIGNVQIDPVVEFLTTVQNNIFVIGSMLSMPSDKSFKIPTIVEKDVNALENEIDNMEAHLDPITNFILPGSHAAISSAHLCRTVARRAERRVVSLERLEEIDPIIKKYLNRLSDYFFVLSRYLSHELGLKEVVWKPEK